MAYESRKPKQNPHSSAEKEIEKSAREMAEFLHGLYVSKKRKELKNDEHKRRKSGPVQKDL